MTPSNLATPFKVGLLVLLAIAATLAMLTTLTGDMRLTEGRSRRYFAVFDDVTGLATRSRIQMAGIPVGTIEDIELVGRQARVTVLVRPDVRLFEGVPQGDYFQNGATIVRKQASLIGDFYLEITPGHAGRPLEDGDEIKNVLTIVGPEQLLAALDAIAGDVQAITASLAKVLGGPKGQQGLEQMLADLQALLAGMRAVVETNAAGLGAVVEDAAAISSSVRRLSADGGGSLERILADLEAVVAELRRVTVPGTGGGPPDPATVQGSLSRLESTLDALNQSLINVRDITGKINDGQGTLGVLVNDDQIARQTELLLGDAQGFVGRLTRLRTLVELRSEFHLGEERFKNVFGVRLAPNPDKFYLLEFIDDFRGTTRVVREQVETTERSAADPVYQETRVTTTDRFKLSLIFGKSLQLAPWVRVTGRFGVFENTGGAGASLGLLEGEPIAFDVDLFDFTTAPYPRMRAMASYRFLQYVFVSGGIDDALNAGRRDYFLGAGIRFDDEDLKAILSTTGVPTGSF